MTDKPKWRCMSCKYSEVEKTAFLPRGFDRFPLLCLHPSNGLVVDSDGPAQVYVKVDFGCVDWTPNPIG